MGATWLLKQYGFLLHNESNKFCKHLQFISRLHWISAEQVRRAGICLIIGKLVKEGKGDVEYWLKWKGIVYHSGSIL